VVLHEKRHLSSIGQFHQAVSPRSGRGNNGAFQAYEDAAGNIWFRAAAGLFRASSDSLESVAPGVNTRSVTSDRDGNLWVGTNGAGLIRFRNRPVRTFTKADGLPNDVVMTVLAAADGKLWAGNNCGGLSWFDGSHFHTYDEKNGLTNSCVYALAEDSQHDLWVGTAGGGLFRFHDGHFHPYTKTDGLGSDTVTCILPSRDGSLWIGTLAGLARLHDGVFRNYTPADGLSDRTIANVFQDSGGVIWVATNTGIDRLAGDKFVPAFRPKEDSGMYIAGEGLPGDLYAVLEPFGISRLKDGKLMGLARLDGTQMQTVGKDLWLAGGSGGVTRVKAAALRNWEAKQQEPIDHTNFGRADGFLSDECDGGYPNLTVTKDSKLWAATVRGAAMLDLSKLPPPAGKPFEYISEVEVDRKKRNAGRELILPPGLHHTELQLGSIELSSTGKSADAIPVGWDRFRVARRETRWRGSLHHNPSRQVSFPYARDERRRSLGS
jgi:Two component regulator propeller